MLVPDHWAEARGLWKQDGKQLTIRRFGWSVTSVEDAEVMARARVEEALARMAEGVSVERREPKVAYNGADGVPIREEVISRHGDVVITRNRYGARCLNTPDVVIADVDFWSSVSPKDVAMSSLAFAPMLVMAAAIAGYFTKGLIVAVAIGLLGLLLTVPLMRWSDARRAARRAVADEVALAAARDRIAAFIARHRDWGLRLYRTPAGLRLIATHAPLLPDDASVTELFNAVDADPVYVRMCRNQHCFRARLTAKPWRIGMDSHMPPSRGGWPPSVEVAPQREAWVAEYDRRAPSHAACAYIETLGVQSVHPKVARVVELHDRECQANLPGMPLA